MYVIGDKVNLRNKPTLKSKSIQHLRIGSYVRKIKQSSLTVKIGTMKGNRTYIDTGNCPLSSRKTIKGWVFNFFFADFKDFKKVNIFPKCNFSAGEADYSVSINFNTNGSYTGNYIDTEKNINIQLSGYFSNVEMFI